MVCWSPCESLSAACTFAAFDTISELRSRHFWISRLSDWCDLLSALWSFSYSLRKRARVWSRARVSSATSSLSTCKPRYNHSPRRHKHSLSRCERFASQNHTAESARVCVGAAEGWQRTSFKSPSSDSACLSAFCAGARAGRRGARLLLLLHTPPPGERSAMP